MKIKTLIVSLLACAFLAACSANVRPNSAVPDWVNGTSSQYPAAQYLTGQGQADVRATAADRARAALAKNFSVTIHAHSQDSAQYQSQGSQSSRALKVQRQISTQTHELIRGVTLADAWQDPATQRWHVLAVLARQKAAQALRQHIGELDAASAKWLKQARDTRSLIDQIRASTHVVTLQTQRAAMQNKLRVVSASGQGVSPRWNLGALKADHTRLLKRLTVTAHAQGAHAKQLKAALAGALANAGYTVVEHGQYRVVASLDSKTLAPRNGWYWRTGRLTLTLKGAGKTLGHQSWTLKTAASAPALVRQRMHEQVETLLAQHVSDTVLTIAQQSQSTR